MKHLGLVFVLLATSCATGTTAYRARFDSQSEAAGLRECAASCEAASASGEDVHTCLSSCPGFSAYPSDRCTVGKEQPGTYCVTVQDRVYPDVQFWSTVASVAADASRRDEEDDDRSTSSASSESSTSSVSDAGSASSQSSARTHSRARPHARSSTRSGSRSERRY